MKRNKREMDHSHEEITAVIEKGCEFEGKLCFEGTARIAGKFRGTIITPHVLVIGEGAEVDAEVEADIVIIKGTFNGKLKAKTRVEVRKPAVLKGDIITPRLSIDDGVIFEGAVQMADAEKSEDQSALPLAAV